MKFRSKPLKTGIVDDLVKDLPRFFPKLKPTGIEEWRKKIKSALSFYCRGYLYLNNVVKKTYRFNLEGKIDGSITEKEKEYSKKLLDKFKQNE